MARPGQFPSRTLAVTGTREQLIAMEFRVLSFIVEADEANAATVYVGDDAVSSTNGIELGAGDSVEYTIPETQDVRESLNISEFYVVGTTGDKVRVSFIERREAV